MGSQPAPPSFYPLPSSLSHGLFPLAAPLPHPLTPSHPLAPRLCAALARIGRRRHTDGHADGQRAMQGWLLTPAPCWHRAWASLPRSTDTPPQTQMWIRRRFISLNLLNFPTYRPNLGELVGGGGECGWDYTCKYSHRPL